MEKKEKAEKEKPKEKEPKKEMPEEKKPDVEKPEVEKVEKEKELPIQKLSVHSMVFRSMKRAHEMFVSTQGQLPPVDPELHEINMQIRGRLQYGDIKDKVDEERSKSAPLTKEPQPSTSQSGDGELYPTFEGPSSSGLIPVPGPPPESSEVVEFKQPIDREVAMIKPQWHPPWMLYRVISGHTGWVRCSSVEPRNEFFATGANDRLIKVWDLATGMLKVTLTGHVSGVRGVVISSRHPYLFSCGEDKQVKCWDLETNKVTRQYHGHLSAVNSLSLHPSLDVLVTCGRDSTVRVWDMRTRVNVHMLTGHEQTVNKVITQAYDPQIISASQDSTIKLWDLAAGKCMTTLTHHKKGVRGLAFHPTLNMFVSGAPDNLKQWKSENGKFIQNLSGHNAIVNAVAVNEDGVLVSGADNGTVHLWDWRTGYNFQRMLTPVQPGSMDCEAGVFSLTYDWSGTRLISTDADKTIKIYKQDPEATEETHPIDWKLEMSKRKKY